MFHHDAGFERAVQISGARLAGGKDMTLRLDAAHAQGEPLGAIAFGYVGGPSEDAGVGCGATIQLAYRLEINEYRGTERVQLNCQQLKLG